jgi:hypothetical protein
MDLPYDITKTKNVQCDAAAPLLCAQRSAYLQTVPA